MHAPSATTNWQFSPSLSSREEASIVSDPIRIALSALRRRAHARSPASRKREGENAGIRPACDQTGRNPDASEVATFSLNPLYRVNGDELDLNTPGRQTGLDRSFRWNLNHPLASYPFSSCARRAENALLDCGPDLSTTSLVPAGFGMRGILNMRKVCGNPPDLSVRTIQRAKLPRETSPRCIEKSD